MNLLRYIGVVSLLMAGTAAFGQKFSVGTNIAGYANLGTLNLEVEYAVARQWTVSAGVKYNPFSFESEGVEFQNRQQLYAVGAKFWPWHIYSGWWIAGKVQYQEYNSGGILSERTEEGDRLGAGFTAGYTYMLHPKVNLQIGVGFWGGVSKYTVYTCPTCGITEDKGVKGFFLPNDVIIGISYVF